jgi:hypothetical protein
LRVVGVVVRQFLGSEIINRDGGCNDCGCVAKLCCFAFIDEILFARLIDIVNVRFVHSITQWLRRNGKLESDLQTGKTAVILGVEEINREPIPRRRRFKQKGGAGARQGI